MKNLCWQTLMAGVAAVALMSGPALAEGEDAGFTDEAAYEEGSSDEAPAEDISGGEEQPGDDDALVDPMPRPEDCDFCRGDEGGDTPVTEGEEPGVIEDDGIAWAGGSPDFCEACTGEEVVGTEPEALPEDMEDFPVIVNDSETPEIAYQTTALGEGGTVTVEDRMKPQARAHAAERRAERPRVGACAPDDASARCTD